MENLYDELNDPQPDWGRLLPREAFYEIMRVLRGALPPPSSDDPAEGARRDRAAMAGVAALLPGNAAEGRLAAQYIVADAWAMDCLRLAGERRLEFNIVRKCQAQAMSLMREGKSALRRLERTQAIRRAIEADPAAAERAVWVEHGTLGMMEAALADAPGGAEDEAADGSPVGSGGGPPPQVHEGERERDARDGDGDGELELRREVERRLGGSWPVSGDGTMSRGVRSETEVGFPGGMGVEWGGRMGLGGG